MRHAALAAACGMTVCLLAACGTVTVDRFHLGPRRAPSRLPGPVPALPEGEPAPWPYEEVAFVQVVVSAPGVEPAEVTERLAREARLLGCDALIRLSLSQGRSHTVGTAVAVVRGAAPEPELPPELDK